MFRIPKLSPREILITLSAAIITGTVLYLTLTTGFAQKVSQYEAIYNEQHALAEAALAKANLISSLLTEKDAEIQRLKAAVPPRPAPAPVVKPDSTTVEVAEGLHELGMFRPQPLPAALQLELPDARMAWQWGLEAKRVPGLEARAVGLEQVITAQGERITLTDQKVGFLQEALVHKDEGEKALKTEVVEIKKVVRKEEIKGKLKLYGGIAIGLGAGWLIFR